MNKVQDNYQKLVAAIKNGAVGVLPTDTLYGLVGSAFSEEAVAKIYRLKERDAKKPLIILISSLNDLKKFEIKLNKKTETLLKNIWPGKVSVILPVRSKKVAYLHRGTKSLAFRLPKKDSLLELLKKTGPLVAPSANREGEKPAGNVKKARQYFGEKVAFYVDGGALRSKPSTLVAIEKGQVIIKREGAIGKSKIQNIKS
ncbi:MAG: L-threonylcarbamoyladenylate synthase [Parcubacteria group bacterium]|jgi:L-threonylcarbamoyladenylate synthase